MMTAQLDIKGFVKIYDPETAEVFYDGHNGIHYENFSQALALAVANQQYGWIHDMAFGNGGSAVDSTGVITYLPTNTSGSNSGLYNETYFKTVDTYSNNNLDKTRNKIEIRHIPGTVYTDIFITCTLDYGEPAGQLAFDNSTLINDSFVFDELGLKYWDGTTNNSGKLLTHVVFHPIQKSLNRLIQIDYTIRVQTLTSLTTAA